MNVISRFFLVIVACSTGKSVMSQPFNIVKEINTTATNGAMISANFCAVNSTLFFSANDAVSGNELWETDGTVAGTKLVKDIFPGTGGTIGTMVNANGIILFVATDAANGPELWKSDGTEAGTTIVKDISPGTTGSAITQMIYHNGLTFFSASNGVNGLELWKSDGTEVGTMMVKDIFPGLSSSFTTTVSPYGFVTMGTSVYFAATNGTHGRELWKSDGTDVGTLMVKDVLTGSGGSINNHKAAVVNNLLYFAASNVASFANTELWATDGTDAGTYPVKDIVAGTGSSSPNNLINFNGTLFFSASSTNNGTPDLWKSDGSAAGTVVVRNLSADGVSLTVGFNNSINQFTKVNNRLFFASVSGPSGGELYVSDGTSAGTVLVKDINPGASNGAIQSSQPTNLIAFNNKLFFYAIDPTYGNEFFTSDGTSAGTVMVKDINEGTTASLITGAFAIMGSSLYLAANSQDYGGEVWKTDGTTNGTLLLKDINTVKAGTIFTPSIFGSFIINGIYYFPAQDDDHGTELWRSDGTAVGTMMVKDIWPGKASSGLGQLQEFDGVAYFFANNSINGMELWKSDGTEAGTVMVADINPGIASSLPLHFIKGSNYVFFPLNIRFMAVSYGKRMERLPVQVC